MKKLPEKTKFRIKSSNNRTLLSDQKVTTANKMTKRKRLLQQIIQKQYNNLDPPKKVIKLPVRIELTDNKHHDELLKAIADLHEKAARLNLRDPTHKKITLEFNFKAVQHMHPMGTLLLLAEIKNARRIYSNIDTFVCKQPQSNKIRQVMHQVGFGDVLHGIKQVKITRHDVDMWNCVSGTNVDVTRCREIINKCLAMASQDGRKIQRAFFNAMSEAMANTVEHAYTKKVLPKEGLRIVDNAHTAWWMFASYNSGNIWVNFCDLGHGIPQTIPHTNPGIWDRISSLFATATRQDDAAIIYEVIRDQKSRTEKTERGLGLLKDIWEFVDKIDRPSRVTILSNRGECRNIRQANQEPKMSRTNFSRSINGTIISWSLPITETEVQ